MGKKGIFLILVSLLFTQGCYDAKEPNNIAFVVALGIDETDAEGIYEYTIQFAKTTQVSGGSGEENGKEGGEIMDTIKVRAPSTFAGINIANQIVSKRFTLAHTRLIVISDEIAKKGVRDIFDPFGRNSDIRPNIYLAVALGRAGDYLESVKPVAEIDPVTYYRLIYDSEYGGYLPRVILKDFYTQLYENGRQNVLPLAGVNEYNGKEAKNTQDNAQGGIIENDNVNISGFDYLMKEYIAGSIDAEKKNASEAMGMAIFSDDKMIGTASGIECLLYSMVAGDFDLSYITFYNEESPEVPVTVLAEQERAPYISVNLKKDKPEVKIKLYLEGQLISEGTQKPVENNLTDFEKNVSEEIKEATKKFLKRTSEEFNSDIMGFGEHAKIHFLTYKGFEEYDWNKKYRNTKFDVEVEFKIRGVGFVDLGDR